MYKHVRNVSTVRKLRLQFDKLQPNFDINEHQVTTYELLFFYKPILCVHRSVLCMLNK